MKPRKSTGLTLIELLVVIFIITLLVGVTVPVLSPEASGRRIREAARGTNVFLSGAQARAIQRGRPVGVRLDRMAGVNGACMVMRYVQVPPPYAGESLGSRARIRVDGYNSSTSIYTLSAQLTGGLNTSLVSVGDLVQFNFQGHLYEILSATSAALTMQLKSTGVLPWPTAASAYSDYLPYQIFRRPNAMSGAPYQVPDGTIVDMAFSGISDGQFPDEALPVTIMFSPTGGLDSIWRGTVRYVPSGAIHLLVGKRENIPVETGKENWKDLQNLWVSVSPQSGQVTTHEMAVGADLWNARAFARDANRMGSN